MPGDGTTRWPGPGTRDRLARGATTTGGCRLTSWSQPFQTVILVMGAEARRTGGSPGIRMPCRVSGPVAVVDGHGHPDQRGRRLRAGRGGRRPEDRTRLSRLRRLARLRRHRLRQPAGPRGRPPPGGGLGHRDGHPRLGQPAVPGLPGHQSGRFRGGGHAADGKDAVQAALGPPARSLGPGPGAGLVHPGPGGRRPRGLGGPRPVRGSQRSGGLQRSQCGPARTARSDDGVPRGGHRGQ